jgi:hypothetical protein
MTDTTEPRSEAAAAVVEVQAAHLAAVDTLVDDASPAFSARFRELLDNPELRATGIVAGLVGSIRNRHVDAGEDPAEEDAWWMRLRELLALSWVDLHLVTPAERTQDWQMVENMMLVWCFRQAQIDSGLVIDALTETWEASAERARVFAELPMAEARKLGRAAGFANRSKALRLAALEGQLSETTDEAERKKIQSRIAALKRRRVG